MIRISEGIWPKEVKERDYFTASGEYRIDNQTSQTMKDSLLFKMSYYRYSDLFPEGKGYDRARGTDAPSSPTLDILEEAYTSESWIVRIYKV